MQISRLRFAGLLFAALLVGCSDEPNVIASVDGKPVTEQEFKTYLKFKRIPEQDKPLVERALEDYLKRSAMAAAIVKSEKLDNQLVNAELEDFKREMLLSRYFESYLKDTVTDEGVRNFYASNADKYQAKSVHAAHILLRVDPKMSESERQVKLSTAHEAYSKLQKGDDFAEVAKAYSEDTVSAKNGGDLGWLKEGAVGPEFSKKLFDLKPGELSEPFLTPFGFHVVKLIEGPQVLKKPLEAVEGDIRYQLRNEAKVTEVERLLKTVNVSRNEK